jgi:hypothetical protein
VSNLGRQPLRQTPWRVRIRALGGTLLWAVSLLVVGGVYLAVNAKVARAGRVVLTYERRKETLLRSNAALERELAVLTAPDRMMTLAMSMGFRPARPEEIDYLVVDGYLPPEPFVAPHPIGLLEEREATLSPAYTETLGEWLQRLLTGGGDG